MVYEHAISLHKITPTVAGRLEHGLASHFLGEQYNATEIAYLYV